MNRAELLDSISQMIIDARIKQNKSQVYMAKALGVSRTTVRKWEEGTSPIPLVDFIRWYNALCLPPQPYVLDILYPDINTQNIDQDDGTRKKLLRLIQDLPSHMISKMYYLLRGSHGSSPAMILEKDIADVQTPLADRIKTCQQIVINYELADALDLLTDKSAPHPDIKELKSTILKATKAVIKRIDNYHIKE